MCGIAGIFSLNGTPVDQTKLVTIRDRMATRGPDSCGIWLADDLSVGLVHRRLAILDLSDLAAQPMSYQAGRLHIVFNGEIYNHKELRSVLQSKGCFFRTESDTEVLLALYAEYGESMVSQLRGMFAFSIWDDLKKTLFLARDQYGIKPLYYANQAGFMYWASQIKPIAEQLMVSPNPAGHVGYFLLGSVPEPFTMFKEIAALPAGSTMSVNCREQRITQYSNITDVFRRASQAPAVKPLEALEIAKGAITESVQAHLLSDVPVGVFLSAGLDSSVIASIASDYVSELSTVTLGFEEFFGSIDDELGPARETAELLSTNHSEFLFTRKDFRLELPSLLQAMDSPSIDGVNTYLVSRAAASSGLKVVLSGLGGDELFGGYSSFTEIPRIVRAISGLPILPRFGSKIRRIAVPALSRISSPKLAGIFEYGETYAGSYLLRRGLFMPWELPKLMDPEMAAEGWDRLKLIQGLSEDVSDIDDPYLKVAALESGWYMRNQLLRDSDWAGMAHSLEIRVPFVDTELLNTIVPALRELLILGKRAVLSHSAPNLATSILNRPKTGFSVPMREWLRAELPETSSQRGLRGWALAVYRAGGWMQQ